MLGLVIAIVLTFLAGLHALWGAGIWWPFKTEAELAAGAVGGLGMFKAPPPIAAYFVALALMVSALCALLLSGWFSAPMLANWFVMLVGWGIATVFLGRGLFGLTPWFARMTPVEPFRSLDRKYYTPLCIALGVGVVVLLLG